MAYKPNVFQPGDILTAAQLNTLNNQIAINNTLATDTFSISKRSGNIKINLVLDPTQLESYKLVLLRQPVSGRGHVGDWRIANDLGYANLIEINDAFDPVIPPWMPNNGILQYEWTFSPTDCVDDSQNLYQKVINVRQWLVDNLKPQSREFVMQPDSDIGFRTSDINLIGLSKGHSLTKMLPFSFVLYKDNEIVATTKQKVLVGCATRPVGESKTPTACELCRGSEQSAYLTQIAISIR